jgi:hypothetical protein
MYKYIRLNTRAGNARELKSTDSRPERIVQQMFQASVTVLIGDGASALFWTDSWLPNGPICRFAPNLYNAVTCRHRKRSVKDALMDRQWTRDVTGALTAAVLCEYVQLWRHSSYRRTRPTGSSGSGPHAATTPHPQRTGRSSSA